MTDFSISTFISPTPDTINPFVDHLVTTKARHLVETCRLPKHAVEDARADLLLALIRAGRRYKHNLSSPSWFTHRVLDMHYAAMARKLNRRPARLDRFRGKMVDPASSHRCAAMPLTYSEFRQVRAHLTAEQQAFIDELAFKSIRQIARERGVNHRTVMRERDQLRDAILRVCKKSS
ncbi:MAG: hypothetical protein ACK5ZG_13480 [Phycisphaerae bacterium]